jgi:hypothetical protein
MGNHTFDKTDLLAYITGSCSDFRRVGIEKHLLECDSCRAYCVGLKAEQEAFLREYPFKETISLPVNVPGVEKKQHPLFAGQRYYALAASLLVFIAAAVFFMVETKHTDFRIKGSIGLKAFVQNREGGIEKREDRVFRTGEKVQFLYSCDAARCFILLSIDTTGAVTAYFPAQGDSSMTLESGQDIPLPNSIVLDEYTGRELFVGLFSKKPLFVPAVKAMVADAFAKSRSMDSLAIYGSGAILVNYPCTVLKGEVK